MPNWCYTTLSVSGPTEDLTRFRDGVRRNDDGTLSIVETYFPTPDDLDISEQFGNVSEDLEAKYAANIAKYGHRSWYSWRQEHYGSKWPDCSTGLDSDTDTELCYHLESAWSPLGPAFRHISTMFPTLAFVLSYDEEGGFYVGAEAYANGETLYNEQSDPEFREQRDDEDEDAYWEAQNDHRNDLTDEHLSAAEVAVAEWRARQGVTA